MDLVDYLQIARRRIWILVGIPLIAAIATSLLVMLSPAQYSATATVSGPALVGGAAGNQYNGSQAVSAFVSAFQSTAQGPAVSQDAGAQTGVPAGQISSGLTVSQVGASSSMALTYQNTKVKQIVPVLSAVVKDTLTTMFGSQVTLAQTQISDATTDLTQANQSIATWEQANKMVDPTQLYQADVQEMDNLEQQQATLQANGHSPSSALASEIGSVRTSMLAFAPVLAKYDVLASARDSAAASLTAAHSSLIVARSQLGAADPSKIAFITGEHPVGSASALLTKVLPVTGAAVFLAVGVIALLEFRASLRARRRPQDREWDEDDLPDADQDNDPDQGQDDPDDARHEAELQHLI